MNESSNGMRRISSLLASTRLVPIAIVVVSLAAGAAFLLAHLRAAAQLRERVREENRLRLRNTLEHVQDYFDAVYSTLLFVSLDDDVKAMRKDSAGFIQRLYDHQWEQHRLAEVYVIEREFPGTRKPFQTFERGSDGLTVEQLHSLPRELEEYQTQMGQIRRFLSDTNSPASTSQEILLCVNDPQGRRARGLVYSLPIRSRGELAGIVSGTIPTYILEELLQKDQFQQVALLINSRGEIYGGSGAGEALRSWFKARFAQQAASPFFAQRPGSFPVDQRIALWDPIKMVSAEQWWLVHLYDRDEYLQRGFFGGTLGQTATAGMLVVAGLALALVARTTAKRLEDQVRHFREREQLERQVQAASEREQRRIGEELHEDLCQRLAGLEALCKGLEKRLNTQALPESSLATEIAVELHEALGQAKQLADELQPVSMLDEGLLAAIEKLARYTQQRSGIECRVETEEFPRVGDPAVATYLFRITQEALANVLKHAQAKHIRISLSAGPDQFVLTIVDDGTGLPERAAQGPGLGLRIMRYRSDLINAVLELAPAPDGGTVVTCRCPLPRGNHGKPSAHP